MVRIKAPTHRPDSNQWPTAFIRPVHCLSSDQFKSWLNILLRCAANSTVAWWHKSHASIQNIKTGNDETACIEKQSAHSIPPLPHTTLICQHPSNQNGHTASTQSIRESNGSDGQQPTFSDFACWIGANTAHVVPKGSNAAEHTKQICSRICPSLPKRFRQPMVGPVCFRLEAQKHFLFGSDYGTITRTFVRSC